MVTEQAPYSFGGRVWERCACVNVLAVGAEAGASRRNSIPITVRRGVGELSYRVLCCTCFYQRCRFNRQPVVAKPYIVQLCRWRWTHFDRSVVSRYRRSWTTSTSRQRSAHRQMALLASECGCASRRRSAARPRRGKPRRAPRPRRGNHNENFRVLFGLTHPLCRL